MTTYLNDEPFQAEWTHCSIIWKHDVSLLKHTCFSHCLRNQCMHHRQCPSFMAPNYHKTTISVSQRHILDHSNIFIPHGIDQKWPSRKTIRTTTFYNLSNKGTKPLPLQCWATLHDFLHMIETFSRPNLVKFMAMSSPSRTAIWNNTFRQCFHIRRAWSLHAGLKDQHVWFLVHHSLLGGKFK